MSGIDWNDLKYFIAVAQHGSTLAAARALGVAQSTVQRRIVELERSAGRQLVRRHASGYRLTEFGEDLLAHAERVGSAAQALEQHLETSEREASGVVRVTCPEPVACRIAQTTLLDRFHARYPRLRVEFVLSDRYIDLMRGEADIALRSGDTDDGELVGRKIGDSVWAVYASRAYIERHGVPADVAALSQHALVGFDHAMQNHRAAQWLAQVAPGARFAARNDSVLGVIGSVKAGIGIAPLPLALGDAEPELVRVLGPIPELARIWRILTRADLRKTPRVAAFFDYVVDEIDTLRPIFGG